MRASDIIESIKMHYPKGASLCILGPSGVGKSQVVEQAGRELGMTPYLEWAAMPEGEEKNKAKEGGWIYEFNLLLQDLVAMRGLPWFSSGDDFTHWKASGELPFKGNDYYPDKGILFVDEFNTANREKQTVLYQLCLNRKIGNFHLKDGWYVVLAGNRAEDRGEINEVPGPLVNRLRIVYFDVNVGDWVNWATERGVRPEIISYVLYANSGDMKVATTLYDNPEGRIQTDNRRSEAVSIPGLWVYDEDRVDGNWPTPRAWGDGVNYLLNNGLLNMSSELQRELLGGTLGKKAAQEFLAYLQVYSKISPPEVILAGKAPFPPSSQASLCFATITSLVDYVHKNKKEIGNLMKLMAEDVIPFDFAMFAARQLSHLKLLGEAFTSPHFKTVSRKYMHEMSG
jgi:hypothetical protein